MASKYYNPRLASIAGAAQGKPYISATPNIEKAFAKFDRVLEIKRREKIQQQKENDKELANIYYANQKFLQNLNKQGKNIPEKHKSGLLQGYANQLKELSLKSKDPNIARADSLVMQQTAFSNLNKIDDSYKKISAALKPTAELIQNKKYDANLVDLEALKNFKKLIEGNWEVGEYGDDGYQKIKFEGSDELMDINSAIESASLIPDQSELHSTISKNMIDAAEEFEKSDYPIDVFKDKINNEILSGQLDYKAALSLAGKIGLGGENNIDLKRLALASREDNDFTYEDVEIDVNGNFNPTGKVISGEEGLIEAVKDHYRKTAANYAKQFENTRIEKEGINDAKDKKPPNDFVVLGEDIATNILKDPISQFQEFSDAPVKYDKLNKIVTIETGVDKDGDKLQPEKFNLNKKPEYLRFIDFVLLQSSYTASEKSKILNGARKWVKERSNMFEAKNTDMTSSDLLGLPTFN